MRLRVTLLLAALLASAMPGSADADGGPPECDAPNLVCVATEDEWAWECSAVFHVCFHLAVEETSATYAYTAAVRHDDPPTSDGRAMLRDGDRFLDHCDYQPFQDRGCVIAGEVPRDGTCYTMAAYGDAWFFQAPDFDRLARTQRTLTFGTCG